MPPARDDCDHGIVWWSESFHSSPSRSLTHFWTARSVASSTPAFAGNSTHVEYASVGDWNQASDPEIAMPSGRAPSARHVDQSSTRPPSSTTSWTSLAGLPSNRTSIPLASLVLVSVE